MSHFLVISQKRNLFNIVIDQNLQQCNFSVIDRMITSFITVLLTFITHDKKNSARLESAITRTKQKIFTHLVLKVTELANCLQIKLIYQREDDLLERYMILPLIYIKENRIVELMMLYLLIHLNLEVFPLILLNFRPKIQQNFFRIWTKCTSCVNISTSTPQY